MKCYVQNIFGHISCMNTPIISLTKSLQVCKSLGLFTKWKQALICQKNCNFEVSSSVLVLQSMLFPEFLITLVYIIPYHVIINLSIFFRF